MKWENAGKCGKNDGFWGQKAGKGYLGKSGAKQGSFAPIWEK
jgi:hypothetical protein